MEAVKLKPEGSLWIQGSTWNGYFLKIMGWGVDRTGMVMWIRS